LILDNPGTVSATLLGMADYDWVPVTLFVLVLLAFLGLARWH